MRKLLLINPFNSGMSELLLTKHNKESVSVRYGILSIASYVKENMKDNVSIKIIDYTISKYSFSSKEEYYSHLKSYINDFKPDIIGISAMFNFLLDTVKDIAKVCKSCDIKPLVFAGGPCAMAYYEEILNDGYVDGISFFEGEIPILRLCESEDFYQELYLGKSWQTLDKLQRNYNPLPEMIVNLDEIPPLHFDLLEDISEYTHIESLFTLLDVSGVSLPIHTSRGCPFNCIFCASHFVHGKKMRKMSAKRVISDVELMVNKYGLTHLEICDDQFLLDKPRAKEILMGLQKFNLKVSAPSGVSAFALDEEVVYLMKQAGFSSISLALESGCQHTLNRIIDKPVDLSLLDTILSWFKLYDIRVHASVVNGFPGETKENRLESIQFLRNSKIDWYNVFCATPLKGSRLYDICIEKGYLTDNFKAESGFHAASISTEDFTPAEITRESYLMNLDLNFINNYNLRSGNYQLAHDYFDYVAKKFPFHAFARYCLAKSLEGMCCDYQLIDKEMSEFKRIISSDKEWESYSKYFNII